MIKTKTFTLIFLYFSTTFSYAQQTVNYQMFFETDSFKISAREEIIFSNFIQSLDTVIISQITISGYCDDVGNEAYNKILSEKRAVHTGNLLPVDITKSITPEMIGKGELPSQNDHEIKKLRANNRRVDVTISYTLKEKTSNVIEKIVEKPLEKKLEKRNSPLSDNQKVGDKITLQNILFIGGRHVLLPESYEALDNLTSTLLEKTQYHILILGHICCIGNGQDGIDYDTGINNLSVARAQTIYDYLIVHGINKKRLSYKGMKADYPTGKGAKQDRRVEIEITKIENEQ